MLVLVWFIVFRLILGCFRVVAGCCFAGSLWVVGLLCGKFGCVW